MPRPVIPPLSIWGIPSAQGYDAMVPKVHQEAIRGGAEVGGGRTVKFLDPDHSSLEALGMRFLIADRPVETKKFGLICDGTVRVYENPFAPDVPPRPVSKTPPWLGLAVTFVGCALSCILAVRKAR